MLRKCCCVSRIKPGVEHTWDMKAHTRDSLSYMQWGMEVELGRDYFFLLPDEAGVDTILTSRLPYNVRGNY